MDRSAEGLSEPESPSERRPRDLALLLLAIGFDPPRSRARDQQADRAGGQLRRQILDQLAALDPEPDQLDDALVSIVADFGDPTGPARGVAVSIREDWRQARQTPAYWAWLLAEALEASGRVGASESYRRRSRGAS